MVECIRRGKIQTILGLLPILFLLAAAGTRAQDLDLDDLRGTLPAGTHTINGEVRITGDLTVPVDATLNIAASSTVRLSGGQVSLIVDGTLNVNGTSAGKVIFTSLDDNEPNQWGGVVFHNGSSGTITYAEFRYGAWETRGMVNIDSASVDLSHCAFRFSGEDGIALWNIDGETQTVTIEDGVFEDNDDDGIEMHDASPVVHRCIFRDNSTAVWMVGSSFPDFDGELSSTTHDAIFLAATTLERSGVWEYAGIPYVLGGDVTVPGEVTLSVDPGVIVKGNHPQHSLLVDGTCDLNGTEAAPVIFTSYQDDSAGGDTNRDADAAEPTLAEGNQWGGVVYNPGSAGTLTYAEFRYGAWETRGMVNIDSASVDLSHCAFRFSGEDGLALWNIDGDTQTVSIEDGVFEDNDDDGIEAHDASPVVHRCIFRDNSTAVWLVGSSFPDFDGDLSSTTNDAIFLAGTTLEHSGVWEYAGIPYVLGGDVTVPGEVTLSVDPGVIVKGNHGQHSLLVDGTCDLNGTEAAPVIFTSYQDDSAGGDTNRDADAEEPALPEGNQWGGLVYNPGSAGTLTYAEFRYGAWETRGMVDIDSASVDLSHCAFRFSGEDGLALWNIDGDTQTVSIEDGVFEDNDDDGIEAHDASPVVHRCTFADNRWALWLAGTSYPDFDDDLSSTTNDAIFLAGTTLEHSGVWEYAGIPYVLGGDVTVPGEVALSVDPGVIVKGNHGQHSLLVDGTCDLNGTEAAPVIFTSYQDDSAGGDTNRDADAEEPTLAEGNQWGGLVYNPGSAGTLTYAEFRYGAWETQGMVNIDSASVDLSHCAFRFSGEDGLALWNIDGDTQTVTVEDGVFEDNEDGIEMHDASPVVHRCTFADNRWAVWMVGSSFPDFDGDLSSTTNDAIFLAATTLEHSGVWEYAGIPYVLGGDVTVPGEVTLSVDPGVIVKGNHGQHSLLVDGTCDLNGTEAAPVIFTSYQDDSAGGDTNRDADAEEPALAEGNQWGGLVYNPGSAGTVSYAEFRYGAWETRGMVDIDSASVGLSHCAFRFSGEDGLALWNIDGDTQTVTVEDGVFEDNEDGIEMHDASPVVHRCTFADNRWAVWLAGTSYPYFDGDLSSTTNDAIFLAGTILEHSGAWEYAGIPYVLGGDVTVPEGVALSVDPGVIVKGNHPQHSLLISGSLTAAGKSDSAIVFTSIEDDGMGDDTNQDGTQSGPDPNEWGGIVILDGGRGTLTYCHLLYGAWETRGLIDVHSGGRVTLDHCKLSRSGDRGLHADDGQATIHNSIIVDNEGWGVFNNNASVVVDATRNWWGDASGPFDDSDADGRVNPDGLGNEVGDHVDYEPWLDGVPEVGKPVGPREPGENAAPSIAVQEPDGSADAGDASFLIQWAASDPDDAAIVSLYYDTDRAGLDGTLIVAGLTEGETSYLWDTAELPEGTYYVYALVDDGTNLSVSSYSPGAVSISHMPPPIPTVTALNVEPDPSEGASIATLRATVSLSAPSSAKSVVFTRQPLEAAPYKAGQVAAKLARIMAFSLSNEHLAVSVDEVQGYFDINTADDRHLIYGDGSTSYANVNIDGEIYQYGRDGRGSFTTSPTQEGNSIVSTWKVGDIVVTQRVSLVRSAVTGREDAAWIQYEFHNQGSGMHEVGLYLQMDTMVGSNDAAPLSTSYGYSAIEQEFTGANMPTFWQAFEEDPTQSEDRLVAQGTLIGGGAVPPDRFVVGAWDLLNGVAWDYAISGDPYGDSAVGMWWNPIPVAPGTDRTVATFYGLGRGSVSAGTLSLNVSAPVELSAVDNALTPNPFEINVLVSNTGGALVEGVQVQLELPEGLSLVAGEAPDKTLTPALLDPGQTGQAAWRVRATPVSDPVALSYTVRVTSTTMGVEPNELVRTIALPATALSAYVTAAEAFRDIDPGEGMGWAMSAVDGSFDEAIEEVVLEIDISAWAPGIYTLGVRGQSSEGPWSAVQNASLEVTAAPSPHAELRLSITSTSGVAGEQVALSVDVAEATGMGIGKFTVSYPAEKLSLAEATFSSYADQLFALTDLADESGTVTSTLLAADPVPSNMSSGSLVELSFEISSAAAAGEVIDLVLIDIEFNDADGTPLSVATEDGQVTVESPIMLGDVNEDGRLTLVDALFTLQAALGRRQLSPLQEQAADVNHDERLTLVDALFILQAALGRRELSAKPLALLDTEPARPVRLQGFFEEKEGEVHLVLAVSDLAAGGLDLQLRYDPGQLKWTGFEPAKATGPALVEVHAPQPGQLRLARLGITGGEAAGLGRLRFHRYALEAPTRVEVVAFAHFDRDGLEQEVDVAYFEGSLPGLPTAFALHPNRPNPFNPETTIRYDLASLSRTGSMAVRLTVYNTAGQRVRVLVDEEQRPGQYAVRWDGRDGHGMEVGSGVYLYRLEAGRQVQVRRMLLLR